MAKFFVDFYSSHVRLEILENKMNAVINYTGSNALNPETFVDIFHAIEENAKNVAMGLIQTGIEVVGTTTDGIG